MPVWLIFDSLILQLIDIQRVTSFAGRLWHRISQDFEFAAGELSHEERVAFGSLRRGS